MNDKREIISQIKTLLDLLTENEPVAEPSKPVEMLTIKECAELIADFPSIPSVSLSHRTKWLTSAQVRVSVGKFSSIKPLCLNISASDRRGTIWKMKLSKRK